MQFGADDCAAEAKLACEHDTQRGHCGAEAVSCVSGRRRGQPMTGFNVRRWTGDSQRGQRFAVASALSLCLWTGFQGLKGRA